jgi:RNase P subunit RPR2
MTLEMTYPRSRLKSSGQCSECRLHPGNMVDSGRVRLAAQDREIELLVWTCDKCGYTMLFDLAVPRARPWNEPGPGGVSERPID